jgi:hypothetical protein
VKTSMAVDRIVKRSDGERNDGEEIDWVIVDSDHLDSETCLTVYVC